MKQLVKKILPKPIVRFVKKIRKKKIDRKEAYRNLPSVSFYQGDLESVLQCCIAYNQYGGYCIPLISRHRLVAQTILSGDVWEPDTLEFLMSHCGDGDIIHAGTYFGDFLPALSRSCAFGAKIWAFEPNLENYRCTLVTIHINDLQNVELKKAGLGEKRGSLSMVLSDNMGRSLGGASQIIEKKDEEDEIDLTTVNIVTIDEIIPSDRKISIIQLDVEKFEKLALMGGLITIQRCKPIIILETLPEENWLFENILQLGYKITGKLHNNMLLRAD